MAKNFRLLIALALLGTPWLAVAQDPDEPTDLAEQSEYLGIRPAYQSCIDHSDGSMPSMTECAESEFAYQDRRLNAAYGQGMVELQERSATMPTCRLDDPSHPDHGMFQATRVLVHDLDRSHGRVPDERSDNLAASLVIAGRRAGLERVDQIALSDDASRLWGVQRPPGVRDHFFDRQASTNTVQAMNTPVSESSNRWPEAMQAYEMVRNNETQDRQQALSQQQTQSHGGPAMSLTR